MSYIGSYLRAPSADNGMPGILGLQQYIQQGFDRGRAQGQNQKLAQLSQAAYNDTGDQQQQDVSKAIGVNPQAGFALANTVGAPTAAQQQQMQLKRYGGVASAIFQAKQQGNNAGAEGLYQSVLPELAAMAAKSGGSPPPANLDAALADPKISGTMYQLAQMYGSGLPAAQKGVVIAPGGELRNPTSGALMASVPNRGQVVNGYYFDPNTGKASPIPITGAQNGAGMAAPVPGAGASTAPQAPGLNTTVPGANGQSVQFNFPPGTPPEVIAAAKASAVANGDISQGQAAQVGAGSPQGQPQTLAQAMATKGQVRTLSAEQAKALGLPDGGVYQQGPDGRITTVTKAADGSLFGGDGSNSFTPEAQQLLAVATEQGLKIPIPSVGMGGAARVQFVNGLAKDINEKHIPLDLALQEMRFGLDADPGLKKSQGLYSTTKTLEAGADNLAQQAVQTAQSVGRGKIPIFNAWVNAGRRATGDPDIARFDRSINAFVNDYAKVVSGSLGSAASSDSARKQAEEQLTAAQSPEQFAASVQQMQQEMHVRTDGMLDSIRQQVSNITNGGLRKGAPAFGNPTTPQGAQQAPQSGAQPSPVDSLLSKYGIQ